MKSNVSSKLQEMRQRLRKATVYSMKPDKANLAGKHVHSTLPYYDKIDSIRFSFIALLHLCRQSAIKALQNYYANKQKKKDVNISLAMNSLSECYTRLKEILCKFIEEKEFEIAIVIYRLLGEVALFAKEIRKAVKYFTQACYIAETYKLHEEQADAFESLGRCYIKLENYPKSILMFKLQLKVGWIWKDQDIELRAYDNLGLAYYYQGDLKAAQFYHYRMSKALIEPMDSPYRKAYVYSEKKLRQRIELEQRGLASYKPIPFRPRPITTENNELRAQVLKTEVNLRTFKGETPRVVLDDPWKMEGMKDLPSPRSRSVYKEEILYEIAKKDAEAEGRTLNRLMSLRSIKTSQAKTRNIKVCSGTESTPTIYFTHLNSSRNYRFVKNQRNNEFTKTKDSINDIKHYLLRTHKVTIERQRDIIFGTTTFFNLTERQKLHFSKKSTKKAGN